MNQNVDELLALIAEKDKTIAEKDKTIAEKDETIAEKDKTIALEKENVPGINVFDFLKDYHAVGHVNFPRSPNSAAKGAVTDPTNCWNPRRIVPWTSFPDLQDKVWIKLLDQPFCKMNLFWSPHSISKTLQLQRYVATKPELRIFINIAVEFPVTEIVNVANKNDEVRKRLGLDGEVKFRSRTNLDSTNSTNSANSTNSGAGVRLAPRPRESFCVGQADQFCMYRHADGSERAVLAIEYKPPHILRVEHVTTGLTEEIQPKRDIINKKDSEYPQWIVAAVITQLFSQMVAKKLRYGYVCTGLVYIFLRIDAADPSVVEYYVSVPKNDAADGKPHPLRRTAVAQVFAFTLQAIAAEAPTSDWLDRIESLELWNVGSGRGRSGEDDGSSSTSGFALPPSQKTPTEHRESHSTGGKKHAKQINSANHADTTVGIRDRPFCTERCLLGLARGGTLDADCPNAAAHAAHGPNHLASEHFLALLGEQLNIDHGADTECCVPMWWRGYIGGLFRVRLHSHGYTLVAKAVETVNRSFLVDELHIYDRLVPIQGQYVPVCLGMLDTVLSHCAEGGVFHHFLLLSWGSWPLSEVGDGIDGVTAAIDAAFRAIHELGVRHGDAELRNVLVDKDTGKVRVIDFERSTHFPPQEQAKQKQPSQPDINSDLNMAATAVQNPNQFQDELQHITTRARQRKLR